MATYRVTTPVSGFSGTVGSVVFVDGESLVEGHLTFADGEAVLDENTAPIEFHHMVRSGYGIEPVPAPKKAAPSKETKA